MRSFRLLVLALVTALLMAACAGGEEDPLAEGEATEEEPAGEATEDAEATEGGEEGETVVVGSADFTEQFILAEMYGLVLEEAGVAVEVRTNLGSREIVFPSIESGELDISPEYTGALNAFVTGGEEAEDTSTEGLVASLEENLPDGLVVLEPSDAQDRDALAVTQETAAEYDLTTVSDLAPVAGELVAGGPAEEETRFVGLPGLQEVYGIEFGEFRPLDAGGPLTTEALNSGQIDVGRVFTTQAIIEANDWVVLEDDQGLVPSENIIPLAREDALTPEIEEALNELSAALTEEALIELNGLVDIDQEDPAEVAQTWLEEQGLIGG